MNRLAPPHSHSACVRRQEEIPSPKAGCGQPVLWLHAQSMFIWAGSWVWSAERPGRSSCVLTDGIQCLTWKEPNSHGLRAVTRGPAISSGRRNFRGRAVKENPKEVRWAEKEYQDWKDQYPGLVWSIEKVKELGPLSGRGRHCKANKPCLLVRTSNKIIYCSLPSQSQQNYKVKENI